MPKKKGKRGKSGSSSGGNKILLQDAADSDPELDALGGAGNDHPWEDNEELDEAVLRSDVAKLTKRKKVGKYDDGNTAFDIDDDDDDSEEEEQDDDDVAVGSEAWGKKKKFFYGGNPNEEKWEKKKRRGGKEESEDEEGMDEAELEAAESRKLQVRQLEQLDEEDFMDAFAGVASATKKKEAKKSSEESVKLDVSKLSKKEKVKLFADESPEFDGIVADFESRLKEAREVLLPVVELVNAGQIPQGPSADYVVNKYRAVLAYCSNVSCYLMFKARRTNLRLHPVTGRLVQYKQLLDQMDASDTDRVVMEQVAELREQLESGMGIKEIVKKARKRAKAEEKKASKPAPKRLKLLDNKNDVHERKKKVHFELTGDEQLAVDMFEAAQQKRRVIEDEEEEEADEPLEEEAVEEGEDGQRRSITYQIEKNKGLTPKRSKLQRNPRVKHRHKFEKAKVRRKGAVRQVRTEVKKYGGELTGINARVKKGVKLA